MTYLKFWGATLLVLLGLYGWMAIIGHMVLFLKRRGRDASL
jgi:hypothetical protein